MRKRLILVCLLLINFTMFGAEFKRFDAFTKKFETINKKEEKQNIYELTTIATKEFGIKKELIWALIAVESSFRNIANGASIGYTQLQLPTAKWIFEKYEKQLLRLGVSKPKTRNDLFNPKTQILISSAYLNYLLKIYNGNWNTTLMAYNAGPNGWKKAKNHWYYQKIYKQMSKI